MAAKLATVEDRIVAGVGEGNAVRDGKVISRGTCGEPLVGAMRFACGYLSPYFVLAPAKKLRSLPAAFGTSPYASKPTPTGMRMEERSMKEHIAAYRPDDAMTE